MQLLAYEGEMFIRSDWPLILSPKSAHSANLAMVLAKQLGLPNADSWVGTVRVSIETVDEEQHQ
jgi:hypothetical protein